MAAKQAKSVASLEPFYFEGDTNDSDYFLVKRIEFEMDQMQEMIYRLYKQSKTESGEVATFELKQQNIKLLSNAEFQLLIQFRPVKINKREMIGILEFKMTKIMDNDTEQHFEISLHMEAEGNQFCNYLNLKNFDVNLTKNLGTTFSTEPFNVHIDFDCEFELVFKLPHDFTDTTMSKLFTEAGEFSSDIKIICDDQMFQCHKPILAMKSDVFKAMLYTNKCTENLTGTVRVDDIDAKTMKTLLKYMYQNRITFEEATNLDVLMAANKYNIVDLVAKCEKYVLMNMSMKNIMNILAIGKFLPTSKIFEKAMEFFHQMEGTKNIHQGKIWRQLKTQNKDLANKILESCSNLKECTDKTDEESTEEEEKE
jgi:hypothetical protein